MLRRRDLLIGFAAVGAALWRPRPACAFMSLADRLLSVAPGAPYIGPGDIVSGAYGWWGLRGYNAAYSGNCCDVYSAADAAHTVLQIVAGNLVLANVGGSLPNNSSNICTIKTLYDQSGYGNNMTQATIANRPILFVNALGILPCMTFTASQQLKCSTSTYIATPWSVSAVALANTGSIYGDIFGDPAYGAGVGWTTLGHVALGSDDSADVAATNNTWHALQGIGNGASSVMNVDGSPTTVSTTSPIGTSGMGFNVSGFAGTTAQKIVEGGYWSGAFTSPQQSAMNANQHTYWGF